MEITSPHTDEEFQQYYKLRWEILRKPWKQPRGSEQDAAESNAYHIMAMENKQIIGVARLEFPQPQITQLRYMAVSTPYQQRGAGREMLQHMEDYAKSELIGEIYLHARENAMGFYKKMGYQVIEKSHLLFNTVQHYKMNKILW
ncbi:hypothetical protein MNBD_GAMMA09-867 [hydrothermal vent metagenome]|uniref:N-acetyltransferase domain-containing protein n=1 Tax=hydrothermal vent metagenome TaxID=652676 RepID=A0A3B0XJR3_9ZZZZ